MNHVVFLAFLSAGGCLAIAAIDFRDQEWREGVFFAVCGVIASVSGWAIWQMPAIVKYAEGIR